MKTLPDLKNFDEATQKNIKDWLNSSIDGKIKDEIISLIQENPEACTNAFYKKLAFGTGGMRGIMGPGSNRMNKYTIRMATKALASHMKAVFSGKKEIKVLIGYDSRHFSRYFAEEAAKTLAANGIHALILEHLRPTPFVSFGVRYLHCQAGVMITASHNPKEYNGYKVYWEDGGQVLPPHDLAIMELLNGMDDPGEAKAAQDLNNPLISFIGKELDEEYLMKVSTLQGMKAENHLFGNQLHIIYSSLHGTGSTLTPPLLHRWGFEKLSLVPNQCNPDGSFPTVKSPNPEDKEALALGVELLKQEKADLFLATDPDADRVGLVILNKKNEEILFSGNAIACLLLEHILSQMKKENLMPLKGVVIKSIVTTELFRKIASAYDVLCLDVLPGFKYVAEKIREFEEDKSGLEFIFGAEESYGYLRGTFSRDKDAVLASALLSEAALKFKLQGLTLEDGLMQIYRKYGVFLEVPYTLEFEEGKEGSSKIVSILKKLEKAPPEELGGKPVVSVADYEKRVRLIYKENRKEDLTLPKTSMMEINLEGGSKIFIRPSGTEPKLKTYLMIQRPISKDVPLSIKEAKDEAETLKKALAAFFEV